MIRESGRNMEDEQSVVTAWLAVTRLNPLRFLSLHDGGRSFVLS